jgi:heme oxygenase
MTADEALALLDTLLQAQSLRDIQEQVFRYSWEGWTYQEAKAEEREIGLQRERALVLKQLNRKLGNLSTQLQSRVSALSIDNIESLGEALLDFNSIADLESWLSQN